MAETTTGTGVTVRHPNGIAVMPGQDPAAPAVSRRGPFQGDRDGGGMALGAVLDGLRQQGLRVQETIGLAPAAGGASTAAPRRRGGSGATEDAAVTIEVPLAAEDRAVLLVEREGVLAWRFPEPPSGQVSAPRRRAASRAEAGRVAVFRLGEEPVAASPGARRGPILDALAGAVLEPVRVIVLKLLARRIVAVAERRIEGDVVPRLVQVSGADPAAWTAPPVSFPATMVPRPQRVLLLLHGCFSSTRGSFGGLCATAWGADFLRQTQNWYDLVLGFDHPTLGATPEENARSLLDGLRGLGAAAPFEVDAIGFSRGGLVLRALAERLLPREAAPPARLRHAVFIGCPNAGTRLAEPGNWREFLDLYTNLAVAAGKAIDLFGGVVAGTVVAESVKTLAGLVHALCVDAIEDEMLPGLAAMRPGTATAPVPATPGGTPASAVYFVMAADFDAGRQGAGAVSEAAVALPRRLLTTLLDRAADRLLGAPNDLVVAVDSAVAFGAEDHRVAGGLRWEGTGAIFHTNYLLHPDVVAGLRKWLEPEVQGAVSPTMLEPPAAVLSAGRPLEAALAGLADFPGAAPVLISRQYQGETLYYPRRLGRLRLASAARGADLSILDALDLHEAGRAEEVAADPMSMTVPDRGLVQLSAGRAIGMLPAPEVPLVLAFGRDEARAPDGDVPIGHAGGVGNAAPAPGPSLDEIFGASPLPAPPSQPLSPTDHFGAAPARPNTEPGERIARRRADPGSWRSASPPASARPAPPPAPAPPFAAAMAAEAEVTCQFGAEMPARPPLDKPARLDISVSREAIEPTPGTAHAQGSASARTDRPITIEVIPQDNCRIEGNAEMALPVPAPGQPHYLVFKVAGEQAGPAQLLVEARQGPQRLVRLALQPQFIESRGVLRAAAIGSTRQPVPPMLTLRISDAHRVESDRFRLLFELESRDIPEINLQVWSDEIRLVYQDYVADLYRRLEGDWGANKHDFDRFMSRLQSFGAELYQKLVPREAKEAIWRHRDQIGSIEVISSEPFIPWEVAHIVEPGDYGRPDRPVPPGGNNFLAELGLIRWMRNVHWPPAELRGRDGMARYVVPEYPHEDWALPGAEAEVAMLERLLGAKPVPPNSWDVMDLLASPGSFDILHFACHGAADQARIWDGGLMMQGRVDAAGRFVEDRLEVTEVVAKANLDGTGQGRPIVFLNACQAGKAGRTLSGNGGMAEAFIRRGAGLFVGALWSVGDGTALAFSERFYGSLKEGSTVTQATRCAREAAKSANEPTWLAYSVYGHPYATLRAS